MRLYRSGPAFELVSPQSYSGLSGEVLHFPTFTASGEVKRRGGVAQRISLPLANFFFSGPLLGLLDDAEGYRGRACLYTIWSRALCIPASLVGCVLVATIRSRLREVALTGRAEGSTAPS